MTVRKLSVALERTVADRAARAAEHHGVSLSVLMNAATARVLVLEAGLAAVREWEHEHVEPTPEELAWADTVLAGAAGLDPS